MWLSGWDRGREGKYHPGGAGEWSRHLEDFSVWTQVQESSDPESFGPGSAPRAWRGSRTAGRPEPSASPYRCAAWRHTPAGHTVVLISTLSDTTSVRWEVNWPQNLGPSRTVRHRWWPVWSPVSPTGRKTLSDRSSHTCWLHYIINNDPEYRTWLCPLMWTQHHTSSLFAALPAAVWSTLEAESAAQSWASFCSRVSVSAVSFLSSSSSFRPLFCWRSRMSSICFFSSSSRSCWTCRTPKHSWERRPGRAEVRPAPGAAYLPKGLPQHLVLHRQVSQLLLNQLHLSSTRLSDTSQSDHTLIIHVTVLVMLHSDL